MNKKMQSLNFQKKPNYIIEDDENLIKMEEKPLEIIQKKPPELIFMMGTNGRLKLIN